MKARAPQRNGQPDRQPSMGSWPSICSKATASPPIRQPLPQRHLDGDRAELGPQMVA